jgi:hypothetical protein
VHAVQNSIEEKSADFSGSDYRMNALYWPAVGFLHEKMHGGSLLMHITFYAAVISGRTHFAQDCCALPGAVHRFRIL